MSDKEKKELFPGEGIGEKIKNEFKDLFVLADYRKEFFVMAIYSIVLFTVATVALFKDKLPVDNGNFVYAFLALAVYWTISDFMKRKKFFGERTQFIIDSFFYVYLMYLIVKLTGGQDSPIRFPLYFLTAISAPLYGGMREVVLFLLAVAGVQIHFFLVKYDISFELLFTILEGFTFISAAIFVKISLNSLKKKADEQKALNLELDVKLEETQVALNRIKIVASEAEELKKENSRLKNELN